VLVSIWGADNLAPLLYIVEFQYYLQEFVESHAISNIQKYPHTAGDCAWIRPLLSLEKDYMGASPGKALCRAAREINLELVCDVQACTSITSCLG
jgi:hypothetical protein